jgi:GntR family transcriptional regulator
MTSEPGDAERSQRPGATPPRGVTQPPGAPTLLVNLDSPVPPYEQLREQIAGLVATGDLPPGSRLPPVRQLAADLGIASGTVARAYRELDEAGLIEGRGRHGTVVRAEAHAGGHDHVRQRRLSAAADQLARTAHDLGFTDDAAIAAARSALSRAAR